MNETEKFLIQASLLIRTLSSAQFLHLTSTRKSEPGAVTLELRTLRRHSRCSSYPPKVYDKVTQQHCSAWVRDLERRGTAQDHLAEVSRWPSYQQQVLSCDPDSVGEGVIIFIFHKLLGVGCPHFDLKGRGRQASLRLPSAPCAPLSIHTLEWLSLLFSA